MSTVPYKQHKLYRQIRLFALEAGLTLHEPTISYDVYGYQKNILTN